MTRFSKIVAAAVLAVSAASANAATLLPDGPGGLTRVDIGDNKVLEFMDWSATVGSSVDQALAATPGFAVANETQMAALLMAFGITYEFTPGWTTYLTTASDEKAENFNDKLGVTLNYFGEIISSIAVYSESSATDTFAAICIGSGSNCARSGSYTIDTNYSDGFLGTGIALVREVDMKPVPLPAGLPLVLTGLAAFGLARRRRGA